MASPGKKSFLLRIDPGLWAEIERLAAHDLRSANAQVEYLLREGLERRGRKVHASGSPAARPRADRAKGDDSDGSDGSEEAGRR